MCKREVKKVRVKVMEDLSHNGKQRWKMAQIDACIAPIVKALQEGGIDMRGSCCGHGEVDGTINLQDGRILIIKGNSYEYYQKHPSAKGTFENEVLI